MLDTVIEVDVVLRVCVLHLVVLISFRFLLSTWFEMKFPALTEQQREATDGFLVVMGQSDRLLSYLHRMSRKSINDFLFIGAEYRCANRQGMNSDPFWEICLLERPLDPIGEAWIETGGVSLLIHFPEPLISKGDEVGVLTSSVSSSVRL